ncbi:MAG: dephospho-CoA kinase [Bacteroidota bacterium]
MKKVGITGGIGSGKTTVCQLFELLGIPIYYADDRAKALIVNNESVKKQIIEAFGEEAYLENGSYNRAYIAGIVFKDKDRLQQLNNIVHPAVFQDGVNWHNSQEGVPYTLKEAALLFEGKGHQYLDKIILVVAPTETRIARVVERDGTTAAEVQARIDKQLPDAEKIKLADFIILNDGSAPLVPQVLKIHDKLRQS